MAKRRPSGRRRSGSSSDPSTRYLIGGIVVSIIVIVLVLWDPFGLLRRTAPPQRKPAAQKPLPADAKPPRAGKEPVARVAIVIDDLGQDLKPAQQLLALPDKVTFSVMPGLPLSKKVADLARAKGHEVMLHLPMEPKERNGRRVAPGTLLSDMTPMEFMSTIADDIASVPGAVAVNNHEGSALTENREAMKFLMAELKARNLGFVDSYTNPRSVAYSTAREFGLKSAKRDVFIDNESDNPAAIRKQLDEVARIARKKGTAIGIGHPHPATIAELKEWITAAREEGIDIVPVSSLLR